MFPQGRPIGERGGEAGPAGRHNIASAASGGRNEGGDRGQFPAIGSRPVTGDDEGVLFQGSTDVVGRAPRRSPGRFAHARAAPLDCGSTVAFGRVLGFLGITRCRLGVDGRVGARDARVWLGGVLGGGDCPSPLKFRPWRYPCGASGVRAPAPLNLRAGPPAIRRCRGSMRRRRRRSWPPPRGRGACRWGPRGGRCRG